MSAISADVGVMGTDTIKCTRSTVNSFEYFFFYKTYLFKRPIGSEKQLTKKTRKQYKISTEKI